VGVLVETGKGTFPVCPPGFWNVDRTLRNVDCPGSLLLVAGGIDDIGVVLAVEEEDDNDEAGVNDVVFEVFVVEDADDSVNDADAEDDAGNDFGNDADADPFQDEGRAASPKVVVPKKKGRLWWIW